ncbi:hypothetical protein [Streptomyces wuyuanensis]|uniref:hypothetical protein n=1 Tax=Streptomyces wuyuanensis TaxID=1196353 RepID=UPI00379E129B
MRLTPTHSKNAATPRPHQPAALQESVRASTRSERQISLADAKHVPAAAKALWEATEWVGCTDVRAERVLPETLAAPLAAALASA